jgi:nucleoid-associated protein YgaU
MPAVFLSDASGVQVMQAAPLAPGDVALDAINYDAGGDVRLSGRGEGRAFVRVYLDNRPVTTSRIRADGRWGLTLPEVETGTYTLRVDQIDAAGAVTARVESPFLRESRAALSAAVSAGGPGPVKAVTIQPGDTLWAISRARYGEGIAYVRVFEANRDRIRDPDLIYPGQIFDLPDE